MGDLTKNLSRHEFRCQCGVCEFRAADFELVKILQSVVDHFQADHIFITSGIRCEDHNAQVGGAVDSQHVKGLAADFYVSDTDVDDIADYLDWKFPDKYGIGVYKTWIHLDVRKTKARWRD